MSCFASHCITGGSGVCPAHLAAGGDSEVRGSTPGHQQADYHESQQAHSSLAAAQYPQCPRTSGVDPNEGIQLHVQGVGFHINFGSILVIEVKEDLWLKLVLFFTTFSVERI